MYMFFIAILSDMTPTPAKCLRAPKAVLMRCLRAEQRVSRRPRHLFHTIVFDASQLFDRFPRQYRRPPHNGVFRARKCRSEADIPEMRSGAYDNSIFISRSPVSYRPLQFSRLYSRCTDPDAIILCACDILPRHLMAAIPPREGDYCCPPQQLPIVTACLIFESISFMSATARQA